MQPVRRCIFVVTPSSSRVSRSQSLAEPHGLCLSASPPPRLPVSPPLPSFVPSPRLSVTVLISPLLCPPSPATSDCRPSILHGLTSQACMCVRICLGQAASSLLPDLRTTTPVPACKEALPCRQQKLLVLSHPPTPAAADALLPHPHRVGPAGTCFYIAPPHRLPSTAGSPCRLCFMPSPCPPPDPGSPPSSSIPVEPLTPASPQPVLLRLVSRQAQRFIDTLLHAPPPFSYSSSSPTRLFRHIPPRVPAAESHCLVYPLESWTESHKQSPSSTPCWRCSLVAGLLFATPSLILRPSCPTRSPPQSSPPQRTPDICCR